MMEWKEYKIGEIGKVITGKTPRTAIADNYGGEIPFLSPSDDMESKFVLKTARYLTDKGVSEVKNCLIPEGAVCVSCIGSDMGKSVMTKRPTVTNQQINSIILNESFDSNFIYYVMQSKRKEIRFLGGNGTAVPILNKSAFSNLTISAPNLAAQRSIASILSSLDDKIAVNRRICENLEAQAQALFKNWFVDFAPFKDGKFVESELGMIPEGWRVGRLSEVCEKITDGSHFSPKDNPTETIPMLSVKDMNRYGFDYSSCKHITYSDFIALKNNDCVPQLNDILVAKDGSYLKEIFLCDEEKEQAILSSIAIFRPKCSVIYPDYLLFFLKQPAVLKNVKDNYVSGSAVPRIVLKDFKKLPMLIPSLDIQKEPIDIIFKIRKKIYTNIKESIRLSTLRDTLLPKLMSGEIEI